MHKILIIINSFSYSQSTDYKVRRISSILSEYGFNVDINDNISLLSIFNEGSPALELKDKYDKQDVLEKVTVEDIRNFGMIPEFIGRLPILFTLKELDRDMMVQVLKEPKNAILKQYQKLLELDEVDLEFDEGAMQAIAEKALEKKTGARALRAVLEEYMLDIMYEIPKDDNIGKVTITREYIEKTGGPLIEMRG